MTDMSPIQAALGKVRARFVSTLPTREVTIAALLCETKNDFVTQKCLNEAQFHLHQMAGTAQTLGFEKLGHAACECEEMILEVGANSHRIAHLTTELRRVLQLMAEAQDT